MITSSRPKTEQRTRPLVYAKGRTCNVCGCRLSQYNKYRRCWAHRPEGRTLSPLSRQDEREAFLDVIRELMEQET